MPIFSNGHSSPVTDDFSLESLPSNLQVQSGHTPAHALAGQLVASNSGCATSTMQPPTTTAVVMANCHTKHYTTMRMSAATLFPLP